MTARGLMRGALLLSILLLVARHAQAAVLAASSLETCIQSSASDISCSKKMVMTVSINNGQNLATQDLQFQLSCVGSSSGSCPCPCNYAKDPSCACRDLSEPMSISLSKTPMWATYPMQYVQSYNYKPYEIIVRPSDRVCLDGDYEGSPTCGWYYVKGAKVADSQGFTCSCSTSQIFDTTFGGSNLRTRANLDCDFWSGPLDILMGKVPCSAHCLEFDPLWYSAYNLGSASMQMTININIALPVARSSSAGVASSPSPPPPPGTREVLQLSPSLPLGLSSNRLVSAQLLGDLATYTQLPVLSNLVLLVPQPTGSTPDQILATNRSQWLLLDPSLISPDGRTCDKVGTSFSAFRFQSTNCARAPQVCLANQIKDLIEVDTARVKSGKVPLHMVTRYTYGSNSTLGSFSAGPVSFGLPVTSTSTSLVVLSVSADSVRFVTNTAVGILSNMYLCTFDEVSCGGFEAGASRGYIWLNLTNTGSLAADFTITVSNCSGNVLPIEAVPISLAPGKPTLLRPPIQLYVSDTSEDPDRFCWVTLYDSQGQISDRAMLRFYTNATVFMEKPTGGYDGTGDGAGEAGGAVDCKKVCSNAMDVLCFVAKGCWGRLGGFLGIVAGVATALGLLLVAGKMGLIASMCSGLASKLPFGSGGEGGDGGNGGASGTAANVGSKGGDATGATEKHGKQGVSQRQSGTLMTGKDVRSAPRSSSYLQTSALLSGRQSSSFRSATSLPRPVDKPGAYQQGRLQQPSAAINEALRNRTDSQAHATAFDRRGPGSPQAAQLQPPARQSMHNPAAQRGSISPLTMRLASPEMAASSGVDVVAHVHPGQVRSRQSYSSPSSPGRPSMAVLQQQGMLPTSRSSRQFSHGNPLYDSPVR